MRIHDLIERLKVIKRKHGNLECELYNAEHHSADGITIGLRELASSEEYAEYNLMFMSATDRDEIKNQEEGEGVEQVQDGSRIPGNGEG